MGYDAYKDSNGVTWTVGPPAGWQMFAYIPDDAPVRYDPPAPDQTASSPAPDNMGKGVPPPTGEQVRVIYLELVEAIEAYAKAHRGQALLQVTAAPPSPLPWWVFVGIGVLALRRRR